MYICIEKNQDGSHAFQIGGQMPDGWAFVPEDMTVPNTFPYVNIETAMVTHPAVTGTNRTVVDGKTVENTVVLAQEYTRLEVTSMTEGEEIPVDEPVIPSVWDELDAAYREGVDSV